MFAKNQSFFRPVLSNNRFVLRNSRIFSTAPFEVGSIGSCRPMGKGSSLGFQPSFLVTEKDLDLPKRYQQYPIRKFSLAGVGIDTDRFINMVKPFYETMEWDYYDVRRDQVSLLKKKLPSAILEYPIIQKEMKSFYEGKKSLNELLACFPENTFSEEVIEGVRAVQPFRKKAAATFHVTFEPTLSITFKKTEPIAQLVPQSDIRSVPRVYQEISPRLTSQPLFKEFLQKMSLLVKNVDPSIIEIDAVLWQTALSPLANRLSTNSPEGIHQDGADFIVSALVIERENVEGGLSILYQDDKRTELICTELQPGEAIFQADDKTPIWHNVTPVKVTNGATSGKRNSLGCDFSNVIRKIRN